MLVWDPLLEKYLAFGTLKSAALGKTWAIAHSSLKDLIVAGIDTSKSEDSPRPCCTHIDFLVTINTQQSLPQSKSSTS